VRLRSMVAARPHPVLNSVIMIISSFLSTLIHVPRVLVVILPLGTSVTVQFVCLTKTPAPVYVSPDGLNLVARRYSRAKFSGEWVGYLRTK
jgi:hypothetical protein